jgi:uncharacterized phage protein (TIGR02220 family)
MDTITKIRARLVWYACKATGHSEMGRGALTTLLECSDDEADTVATAVVSAMGAKATWDGERLTLKFPQAPGIKQFREVFAYWQKVMGKETSKPTKDRQRAVIARLKEKYSVDELKLAIDGISLSEWHMGTNPESKEWNDLAWICAKGSRVEQWRDHASPHRSKGTKAISDDDIAAAIYSGDEQQAIAVLQRLSHQDQAKWLEAAAAALGLAMDEIRRRIEG